MKTKSLILVIVIAALVTLGITQIAMSGSDGQERATPIQVGVMSEIQREHSKLYGEYHTGRKLDALPPKAFERTTEPGVYIEPGTPVVNSEAPTLRFEDFIRNLNCEADLVATVLINDQTSQLTENSEFIFTDFTATIGTVYKNNQAALATSGNPIIISRPGGKVEIKGKVVSALDASFKMLKPGRQYLLFLKYITQTGAYRSIRQGSFEIKNDELVAMTEEALPDGSGDTRAFSSAIQSALYSNCSK